jgi:hypothetical protein
MKDGGYKDEANKGIEELEGPEGILPSSIF